MDWCLPIAMPSIINTKFFRKLVLYSPSSQTNPNPNSNSDQDPDPRTQVPIQIQIPPDPESESESCHTSVNVTVTLHFTCSATSVPTAPRYGAHICALFAALLLLLSVSLLHSRLSFFNSHSHHPHLPHDYSSFNPLLDDLDSDSLTTSNSNDDRIDELDDAVLDTNNNNEEFLAEEEDEDVLQNQNSAVTSSYFFDPVKGVVRRSFNRRSIEDWEDYVPSV
ncbi:UNVERIFIED_CONTAM: hypothetical protein Slati_4072000 [Sesamum latifolium]|uniref:Transmembrane protein n=1 Tax=Sesamum latifolium TaxID=2727402 RepID=A0AAW2TVU9_9LAMI